MRVSPTRKFCRNFQLSMKRRRFDAASALLAYLPSSITIRGFAIIAPLEFVTMPIYPFNVRRLTFWCHCVGVSLLMVTGCGPKAEIVGTRALRIDTGNGLESIAIESMFKTKSMHGQQVIYRVGLVNSQQQPIRAPGNSYRDENGNLAATKAAIAEEATGRPTHVRVQLPMRSMGLNERHLPVYGQARLTLPNGDVIAEDLVELPLQYADVGTNVSHPEPTTERRAAGPAGAPPPEFARPRSTALAGRDDLQSQPRNDSDRPAPRAEPAGSINPQIGDSMARELVEQEGLVKANPNNVQNQLRLRMMYVALGRHEDALAFIQGTNQENHREITEYVRRFVPTETRPSVSAPEGYDAPQPTPQPTRPTPEPRVARREPEPTRPTETAWTPPPPTRQPEPVAARPEREPLINRRPVEPAPAKALAIPKAAICKRVNGFGDFVTFDGNRFKQDDFPTFQAYIEVENYTSTQTRSGMYRTLLALEQRVFDERGVEVWAQPAKEVVDVNDQPRDTFFLHVGPIRFAQELEKGRYRMVFDLTDRTSGQSTRSEVGFEVTGG